MTDKAESTSEAFLVTATEGVRQTAPHLSTARTEAPASTPILDAETERLLLEAYGTAFDHARKQGSWREDEWVTADYAEQSRLASLVDDAWDALRKRIAVLSQKEEGK